MAVVGEWRTSQRHPGDRPGGQSEHDTLKAHTHPRAHCPSRTLSQVGVHSVCHA